MGIWIRSQNKKTLTLIEGLRIQGVDMKDETHKRSIVGSCNGTEYYLAVYETEERALEVLKAIEDVLCDNEAYRMGIRKYTVYAYVYQMPKN